MGCGCKNKKNRRPVEGAKTSRLVEDQKDYKKRVSEAMRQFMEIKKRKQNLKS
jgi:hypothetical protein